MEKNVSSVAEQDKTAEVKKNPKLIELARPYKFDDKEYTEIDLSGLDDLTIKDAVLIIKKLYNEGEMAVMITPETATAYTDALAAAATKLPIEFFQLLPIGASKKVRQTVQASLRSAAAEEDGDEDEHSHIMKFGKPYTYKGEKYTEVDLSRRGEPYRHERPSGGKPHGGRRYSRSGKDPELLLLLPDRIYGHR